MVQEGLPQKTHVVRIPKFSFLRRIHGEEEGGEIGKDSEQRRIVEQLQSCPRRRYLGGRLPCDRDIVPIKKWMEGRTRIYHQLK